MPKGPMNYKLLMTWLLLSHARHRFTVWDAHHQTFRDLALEEPVMNLGRSLQLNLAPLSADLTTAVPDRIQELEAQIALLQGELEAIKAPCGFCKDRNDEERIQSWRHCIHCGAL